MELKNKSFANKALKDDELENVTGGNSMEDMFSKAKKRIEIEGQIKNQIEEQIKNQFEEQIKNQFEEQFKKTNDSKYKTIDDKLHKYID